MFKASISALLTRSRAHLQKNFATETQKMLFDMLYNDQVNVLTTFEMNRVASYTFSDMVCGEIFDLLEHILRNPLEFTVLCMHKTLVLMHHIAVYASQRAANNIWILKSHVKPLLEYNTVLMGMNNPKSLVARMNRVVGGSVDRGRGVRESAKVLLDLLSDVELFKKVRFSSADPDSLVPVGDQEQVGFVSDEVRRATLEDKLRKQHEVNIRSNLKGNGKGGFGSGVVSKNGKTIVGAAHSMEEMLKMAMKNQVGYRDGDMTDEEKAHYDHIQKLQDEIKVKKAMGLNEDGSTSNTPNQGVVDLLDFGNEPETFPPIEPVKSIESLPYAVSTEEPFIMEDKDEVQDPFHGVADTIPSALDPFSRNALSQLQPPSVNSPSTMPTKKSNSDEMDLLSMTMGGMAVNNNTNDGSTMTPTTNANGNIMGGVGLSSSAISSINIDMGDGSIMGGSGHSSSVISSIDIPSGMNSGVMGGSSGDCLPSMPDNTEMPSPPPNAPPPPPPPQMEPPAPPLPTPNEEIQQEQGMHSSMGAMDASSLMGGVPSGQESEKAQAMPNNQMGMNGMNMNGMNMNPMGGMNNNNNNFGMPMPMMNNMNNGMGMMMNPQMMQNSMQNMTPEQQGQMMQQMMMMQQMLMMQMQNGNQNQSSSPMNGQNAMNNPNNGDTAPSNSYPAGLNPFNNS